MQDISKELILQASGGDLGAFEEIYKLSSGFVYSVVFRVIGSIDLAEDVSQEVFLKIHRNLKNFQFRSGFKTWIYRIAVNCAINTYRKRSKEFRRQGDFDLAIKKVADYGENEQSGIVKEVRKQSLDLLLSKLNPDQRTCIILRELEGLSYKEIAEILKININTVRSRLKRARCLLLSLVQQGVVKNEL